MKHLPLEAWSRTPNGTGGAHVVRAEGYIPAILIGHHEAAVPLKIKAGDMTRVLKQGGRNALVDLAKDGENLFAMVREFDRDPISRAIVHVSFQRVSADEKIEAHVPVALAGHPADGLEAYVPTLEIATLHVKAVPEALPSHITVDAGVLQPNHPFHASDIKLPEGVELVTEGTHVVASLVAPHLAAAETEEEAAAEAGAEEAPAAGE